MKILVGVDDSAAGCNALAWAVRLAARTGAKVEAVRSWTYTAALLRQLASHEAMDRHAAEGLRALVENVAGPDNQIRKTVLRGPAQHALLGLIERRKPSLVVIGRRGDERVTPRVLGSVSRRLVDAAPCPLVVVSGESGDAGDGTDPAHGMTILVGFDGSVHAERALAWAGALAQATGGRVVLGHAVAVAGAAEGVAMLADAAGRMLDRAAAAIRDQGVDCETVVAIGDPRRVLEEAAVAHHADLITIGPRGEGGLAKLVLGTVAAYLAEHSDHPVAIVPSSWQPAEPATAG